MMRKIDPLFKVKTAFDNKIIQDKTFNLILKRNTIVEDGIKRIQKLTNIEFPDYFIEPSLLISTSPLEFEQFSIMYARTIPICDNENKIKIFIQLFAPLVIYGLKGTIHSVIAHEFLHYLDLINKIMNLKITTDDINNTLFENTYTDYEKTFDHNKVFKKDRYLIKCISKKFSEGFNDEQLNKKAIKLWIEKRFPIEKISIEKNFTKLSFLSMVNTEIDENIRKKVSELL
ncbi:MAG TPA: hypothetical protein VN704_02525 [Verrucomicrobiae bacterium]|nr:hypothetical protein [Verrucomicrobiae bacterium]